jgi:hypothetical protein
MACKIRKVIKFLGNVKNDVGQLLGSQGVLIETSKRTPDLKGKIYLLTKVFTY